MVEQLAPDLQTASRSLVESLKRTLPHTSSTLTNVSGNMKEILFMELNSMFAAKRSSMCSCCGFACFKDFRRLPWDKQAAAMFSRLRYGLCVSQLILAMSVQGGLAHSQLRPKTTFSSHQLEFIVGNGFPRVCQGLSRAFEDKGSHGEWSQRLMILQAPVT